MCIVDESVEDGVAHGGIACEFVPGVDGVLTGDEGGAVALAVVKDLEEQSILIGFEGERPQSSTMRRSARASFLSRRVRLPSA